MGKIGLGKGIWDGAVGGESWFGIGELVARCLRNEGSVGKIMKFSVIFGILVYNVVFLFFDILG